MSTTHRMLTPNWPGDSGRHIPLMRSVIGGTDDCPTPVLIMPVPLLEGDLGRQVRPRRKLRPNGTFRRRSMYKSDLAAWYGVGEKHFRNAFLKPLLKPLKRAGYLPTTRLLTPAMIHVICDFHGDPIAD